MQKMRNYRWKQHRTERGWKQRLKWSSLSLSLDAHRQLLVQQSPLSCEFSPCSDPLISQHYSLYHTTKLISLIFSSRLLLASFDLGKMSSQSSRSLSANPSCKRCHATTVVMVSWTSKNYGREFYSCRNCDLWHGWCKFTTNSNSRDQVQHHMKPSRDIFEMKVTSILNKQLVGLIILCVLMTILCVLICLLIVVVN